MAVFCCRRPVNRLSPLFSGHPLFFVTQFMYHMIENNREGFEIHEDANAAWQAGSAGPD